MDDFGVFMYEYHVEKYHGNQEKTNKKNSLMQTIKRVLSLTSPTKR